MIINHWNKLYCIDKSLELKKKKASKWFSFLKMSTDLVYRVNPRAMKTEHENEWKVSSYPIISK